MKIFNNLKIKHKQLAMVMVPIVYLVYLAFVGVKEKQATYSDMHNINELSTLAVKISSLVHETQKERGFTAGFLGSGGKNFSEALVNQRKTTDLRLSELTSYMGSFARHGFGSEFNSSLDDAIKQTGLISSIRESVSSLDIAPGKAIGYYTNMNGLFLKTISAMTSLSGDGNITRMVSSYENFLQGKERAGIERAVLANTFAQDSFGPGMYRKLNNLVTEQDTYTKSFMSLASESSKSYYIEKMKNPVIDEVEKMRARAFEVGEAGGQGFGIDAGEWFKAQTAKINLLKEVEDYLSERLNSFTSALAADAKTAMIEYIVVSVVVLVFTFAFAYLLSLTITNPTRKVADLANAMAEGRIGMTVDVRSRDEVGFLSISFNKMSHNMKELISSIFDASNQIASSAGQIAASSEQMAQGAESQNRQAEQVATAVEEMSATVLEVARNSNDASEAANIAVSSARKGGEVVSKTIEGMNRISDSVRESANTISALGKKSDEIGEIIAVIEDIADQTNLLALNAAIEAARAGDQGRGFAVVADEVRKLAERTTHATKEIAGMIKSIQTETEVAVRVMKSGTDEVEKGVAYAREAGNSLEEIVSVIDRVSGMIQQIATAAEEQSAAAEEISASIERVASVSRETSSGVQQSTVATQELSNLATNLQTRVQQFQIAA